MTLFSAKLVLVAGAKLRHFHEDIPPKSSMIKDVVAIL